MVASLVRPSGLSNDQIDHIVALFREKYSYSYSDDIVDLVNRIGGRLSIFDPFSEMELLDHSGTLVVAEDGKFVINVSSFDTYFRQRFTIAHELGHFVLHSKLGKLAITVPRSAKVNRAEYEANWFAAELLMPKTIFKEKSKLVNGDVSLLSSEFGVSSSAIVTRKSFLRVK